MAICGKEKVREKPVSDTVHSHRVCGVARRLPQAGASPPSTFKSLELKRSREEERKGLRKIRKC